MDWGAHNAKTDVTERSAREPLPRKHAKTPPTATSQRIRNEAIESLGNRAKLRCLDGSCFTTKLNITSKCSTSREECSICQNVMRGTQTIRCTNRHESCLECIVQYKLSLAHSSKYAPYEVPQSVLKCPLCRELVDTPMPSMPVVMTIDDPDAFIRALLK